MVRGWAAPGRAASGSCWLTFLREKLLLPAALNKRLETYQLEGTEAPSYLFNLPQAEQNCLGYMGEAVMAEG